MSMLQNHGEYNKLGVRVAFILQTFYIVTRTAELKAETERISEVVD